MIAARTVVLAVAPFNWGAVMLRSKRSTLLAAVLAGTLVPALSAYPAKAENSAAHTIADKFSGAAEAEAKKGIGR